jgi:hypothetical protein
LASQRFWISRHRADCISPSVLCPRRSN